MSSAARNPERVDLTRLFAAHADGLAGAVRGVLGPRADVVEILQEAFLRAWRAEERGTRPRDPKAWIFVVVLNTARDLRRRALRRRADVDLEEIDPMKLEASQPEPGQRMEVGEALLAARRAIHDLPQKDREVFLLRVSGDLTFEAIADALSIPLGTAKTRMRLALAELRRRLADHEPNLRSGSDAR